MSLTSFWRLLHARTGHTWRVVDWLPTWIEGDRKGRFREHICDRCDFVRYEFDPPSTSTVAHYQSVTQ